MEFRRIVEMEKNVKTTLNFDQENHDSCLAEDSPYPKNPEIF